MEKKRIIAVDDEEDFLRMVKMNLEQTGRYEVRALLGAKDIIAQIHEFKPDVILLDMLMPEVGGIDVCRMLNDAPGEILKNIPIIMVSAVDKIDDQLKAWKQGIVTYVEKPVETFELDKKIKWVLEKRGRLDK